MATATYHFPTGTEGDYRSHATALVVEPTEGAAYTLRYDRSYRGRRAFTAACRSLARKGFAVTRGEDRDNGRVGA